MNETLGITFRLPNKINDLGLHETERIVRCKCIQGTLAQEIQALWDAYHNGCAGLNPTTYRECVEALKHFYDLSLTRGMMGANLVEAQEKAQDALQHAKGKE